MELTYIGHSCFRIKGKEGVVVTDPYDAEVGFALPSMTADVVTTSHSHFDHAATGAVKTSSRRDRPFIISQAGEYEVGGISVFGTPSYHDDKQGAERGRNVIFRIVVDQIVIGHLGDLGHPLTQAQLEEIGQIDILLCPVGGVFTIGPKEAVEVVRSIDPSIVIPMHYRTEQHNPSFADVAPVEAFLKEFGTNGGTLAPMDKLVMESTKLPEELQVVVLQPSAVSDGRNLEQS